MVLGVGSFWYQVINEFMGIGQSWLEKKERGVKLELFRVFEGQFLSLYG